MKNPRIRICFYRLSSIALFLSLLSCITDAGITRYNVPKEKDEKAIASSVSNIQIVFSLLDKIGKYIHTYPTGLNTPAPNLDPRVFYAPESLMEEALVAFPQDKPRITIGLPAREYIILGEIDVDLEKIVDKAVSYGGKIETFQIKDTELQTQAMNGRPYHILQNVNWAVSFDNLKKRAAKIGADAAIEVFCGKGVSSFWYPPSTAAIPMMGPSGHVVGSYSFTTPGGVGMTGWKLMGLAIKWGTGEKTVE